MSLFTLFSNTSPNKIFLSILLGVVSGLCYTFLIPVIMLGVSKSNDGLIEEVESIQTLLGYDVVNYPIAIFYFICCLLIFLLRSGSELLLIRTGSTVARKLRIDLYEKVLRAPYSSIEKTGYSKLISVVNIDVPRVINGASVIPAIFINLVTVVGILGFLLYLNSDVFRLVLICIFVGIFIYQVPIFVGRRYFDKSRVLNDSIQESFKGLVLGIKELKLSSSVRDKYLNDNLIKNENELLKNDFVGHSIIRYTITFGDLISFFFIGFIAFVSVNYYSVKNEELVGVVMALLYITTPISIVLNSLPNIAIASVSLNKISNIIDSLPEEDVKVSQFDSNGLGELKSWDEISLNSVSYKYEQVDGEQGFSIGPIDLKIKKGEVIFLVGGNGSGKSTLSKILTLHYRASSGEIFFGNQKLTEENISRFRECIYAIYTDYYLFDKIYVDLDDAKTEKVNEYLIDLGLQDKVYIKDGGFSTTKLSDGQRKRLALLLALLADKEFYLFDEWAADQDPEFKFVFYKKLLPDLKRAGKAVLVISHDDRYFGCADNIVQMDDGNVCLIQPKKEVLEA